MRNYLLISAMALTVSGAGAQDPDFEFEFELPEIQAIQLSAVEEKTQDPIPFVSISVEYADTIVNCATDEKGHLDFMPLSFPLTLTATCEGMVETTYGLMEHPEEPLTILMIREPAKEENHLSMLSE